MTWRDVAATYPEFVQWAVQKYGQLPDGPVQEKLYMDLSAEYIRDVASN